MTHLLDTDHLSILQRPGSFLHSAVLANLNRHTPGDAVVSIVSFHEQMLGCNNKISKAITEADLVRGHELFQAIIEDYTRFTVLPFDAAAAGEFTSLRSRRIRIATKDLRIATTSLTRNLTLVTRNRRDFGLVPGLRIEDWTK